MFGLESAGGDFDISGGKPNRSITPAQFTERLNAGATVLDVRTADERAGGAIAGSIHIPDAEIHADSKAIAHLLPENKNTTLIIHCAAGARASGVVELIAELGYENTFYLNSQISIDADGNVSF